MSNLPDVSLRETLLAPLLCLISSCPSTRRCPDLSDEEFLRVCLLRTLAPQESGRDFLQSLSDVHDIHIQRSQFFDTIKSQRRLEFVREIGQQLKFKHQHQLARLDPFANFPELAGREIYAGDGHYIEHACHDPRSDYKGKPYVAYWAFLCPQSAGMSDRSLETVDSC
jgi:hypothetical protein